MGLEQKVKERSTKNQATQTNPDGVLEVRNLTKKFGAKLVLDNISLSIEKGKTTVVIGPSGCGRVPERFILMTRGSITSKKTN